MLRVPLPGLPLGPDSGVRAQEEMAVLGRFNSTKPNTYFFPSKIPKNSEVFLKQMTEEWREDSIELTFGFLK